MANYKAGSLVVDILANDQVSTTLDKIQNKIGAFGTKSTRLAKNGGSFGFLKIAKWTAVFAVARRFGRVLGNIVQAGADYTETLNLWETAMGSNLNVATEFVNKMNEAYGISEKTLMNAQAIFKNMLGSLGQISDTMAYSLSEGITQMALDYASLYNQTFEQAFTKFQAALAGQVRPIRSVAGYDITENTLYQLYQSLGGTKTMRQLSRTEKQLLSILAIFNQMTASGAVGDLEKTMESFANQSRVMAEAWQRVLTYSGTLLTHLIEQSGLMIKVNAILIFIGDTLKAVAESMGAIKSFGGNIWEETTNGALGASEAIDEVQGKLLDFDKFRSLSGAEENALGLDEKLLQALSGYNTILNSANNKSQELANTWKENFGLVYNTETKTWEWGEGLNEIIKLVTSIGKFLSPIFDFVWDTIKLITPLVNDIIVAITPILVPLSKILNDIFTLVSNIIKLVTPIIGLVVDLLNILSPILEIIHTITWAISTALSGALYAVFGILTPIVFAFEAILKVIESIAEVVRALFQWDWSSLGKNLSNIWTNWRAGELTNALGNFNAVPKFAEGGLPDKGTLFRAGEAGAEIVYNTPSGQSGVVNVQQIQSAFNGALNNWWSNAKHDIPQFKEVSKTGIYEVAKSEMRRRGEW